MSGHEEEDDNTFNIKRKVFFEHGRSIRGTVVRLNAGGRSDTETKLYEGKTDEQGHFQISYKFGSKLTNNNNNNKIEMRILVGQGNKISIFTQKLNPEEKELLNLFPSTKVQQPPQPEYRCLTAGIEKDDISSIHRLAIAHKNEEHSHE